MRQIWIVTVTDGESTRIMLRRDYDGTFVPERRSGGPCIPAPKIVPITVRRQAALMEEDAVTLVTIFNRIPAHSSEACEQIADSMFPFHWYRVDPDGQIQWFRDRGLDENLQPTGVKP